MFKQQKHRKLTLGLRSGFRIGVPSGEASAAHRAVSYLFNFLHLRRLILVAVLVVAVFVAVPVPASAQDSAGAAECAEAGGTWDTLTETCIGYEGHDCEGGSLVAGLSPDDENHCGILDYIVIFINVLSALAGIIIVISIIYGGIQYSSAGSDPQKVAAAKARIRNAIIALLLFIFGVGLLNYLVPGGVL